jgi:hypothetical protein
MGILPNLGGFTFHHGGRKVPIARRKFHTIIEIIWICYKGAKKAKKSEYNAI